MQFSVGTPPSPEDDLWVLPGEVRPLPGHKADGGVIRPQQDTLAVRRVPHTEADALPPAQRMERMRYPDKMRPRHGTGRILG